ncbi:MAG: hypothetical protein H0T52_17345 [Lautropia sp.]|nr:hypothetical protein [Lautropia sp.]
MTARLIPPFHYQVGWLPRNRRPGEHPAGVSGDGGAFRGERLMTDASQARSLSVRATLRDPLRRLWVRENQQRAPLDLFVLVDVSRSMRVAVDGDYCRAAADLLASAALSAYRGGDRVGAVCASARIDPHLWVAPARQVQPAFELARRLRAMPEQPAGPPKEQDSVEGMLDVWRRVSMRRSLVLLVSDFHAPIETWTAIFDTLRHHQVVPVMMQDDASVPVLPAWGLVHLDDSESGHSRTLFMRPSLQRRLVAGIEQRHARLATMFETLGLRPCYLRRPFDPAQLTAYFHASGLKPPGGEAASTGASDATAGTRDSRTRRPQPAR